MIMKKHYLIVAALITIALCILLVPVLTKLTSQEFANTRLDFSNPPIDPIQVLPADLTNFDMSYIHALNIQKQGGREVITLSKTGVT